MYNSVSSENSLTAAGNSHEKWLPYILAVALALLLLSILSLPMLPTNDGPLHAYYAHVFWDLLAGRSTFSHSFQIRSVFPPYALQVYLLIGLEHLVGVFLTERLIACLSISLTFIGFTRLSRALGHNGLWGGLFALPFLANWVLYMGFTNFALGLATLFFAMGYWLDHVDSFKSINVVCTTLIVFLLAAEHPVPLLMFFVFVGLEFVASYFSTNHSLASADFATLRNLVRRRRYSLLLICILAAAIFVWLRAFVGRDAPSTGLPSVAEIGKRVFSLLSLNEISPFSFDWWLYTLALFSVAFPSAIFAAKYLKVKWRNSRLGALTLFLAFCLLMYLFVPQQVNGSFHVHRRFSIAAIFLILAIGSAAPASAATRRVMAVICLVALATTTALQFKANKEAISSLTPLTKTCVGAPGSRLLLVRFRNSEYGHPRRYVIDDAASEYWSYRCQASLINSGWLSSPIYPLETAKGLPSEIDERSAASALLNAAQKSRPLPYFPDVIFLTKSGDRSDEQALVETLESTYGFKVVPGTNRRVVLLYRAPSWTASRIHPERPIPSREEHR